MAFAVGRAAGHGCADARREIRIYEIHIHRYVKTRGSSRGEPHCLVHYGAHSTFIELTHRDNPYPRRFENDSLLRIDAPGADQHAIFRMNFWRKATDMRKLFGSMTEDGGEGHAVDIA